MNNAQQQPDNHWVAFLQRPTFSLVLSAVLLIAGWIAWQQLSVRRYPMIEVPRINIAVFYPNASAQLVERKITLRLESALAKVPGIETVLARSQQGSCRLELSFRPGTQLQQALTQVQQEISRASLPKEASPPRVYLPEGGSKQFVMFLAVSHPSLSAVQLTHQVRLHLIGALQAIAGVADLDWGGESYSMQIRLDRAKMANHQVGADQVVAALKKYEVSLPSGTLHDAPINIDTTLQSPEDFAAIPIKRNGESVVLLGDVAHVQLAEQTDKRRRRLNGKPAITPAIRATSSANLVQVSDAIRTTLHKLQQRMPANTEITVLFDAAQPVRESLRGVRQAIGESVLLVVLILFAFLRRVGMTLIPVVVIPLSLISTAALLRLFDCSLNVLSLLGLALAVGIVVDDAIVVVENIHRHMQEGLSARQAALKSGRELGFAIVGITLTLVSVFTPIALVPGLMSQIFGEFSLALAGSVLISGVLALTLSPMMATYLLSQTGPLASTTTQPSQKWLDKHYAQLLAVCLPRKSLLALLLAGLTSMVVGFFVLLPKETTPHEDVGIMWTFVNRIANQPIAIFDNNIIQPIEQTLLQLPETKDLLLQAGEWGAHMMLILKPLKQRARSDKQIEAELKSDFRQISNVDVVVGSNSPRLPGMSGGNHGSAATLVVKTTDSYMELNRQLKQFVAAVEKQPCVDSASKDINQSKKGFSMTLNTQRMMQLGIDPQQVSQVLQTFFDKDDSFTWYKDGLSYQAVVQLDQPVHFIEEVEITTQKGLLVPLSAVATLHETTLPQSGLQRQDQMRAAHVSIHKTSACSLQETTQAVQQLAQQLLPDNFVAEWDESTKRQQQASRSMLWLFALAVLFIYGALAVLFNSFLDPLVILFTVPLACGGALALMWLLGMPLSMFSYLGLITLVGLITKHGILLVEFGGQQLRQGLNPLQAAQQAAQQRFRPILMTALSTAIGHAPLLWATGAGSVARRAMGVVLVGGMVTGTVLTLLIIPVLWAWLRGGSSGSV